MSSVSQSIKVILFLGCVFMALAIYNFTIATWSDPAATAPDGNVAVPISESSGAQVKLGNLGANIFAANTSVWSPEYCDENGDYCVTAAELYTLVNGTSDPDPDPTYSNCTFGGVVVNHGSSRTFYSQTSSTNCTSYDQVRSCNDGTLSGSNSYQYTSCSPISYSNCNVNGTVVNHGSSRTFYSVTTPPSGGWTSPSCSDYDQVRTCTNGSMSGSNSYIYSSCSAPASCDYNGNTYSDGYTCITGVTSTGFSGGTWSLLTCENGSMQNSSYSGMTPPSYPYCL